MGRSREREREREDGGCSRASLVAEVATERGRIESESAAMHRGKGEGWLGWLLVKGVHEHKGERERERERNERGTEYGWWRSGEERGREGCWGGSGETEFTPSRVRQFVSDYGARKMLPVVHETGGPPSSRGRCRAIAVPHGIVASVVPGEAEKNAGNSGAGRVSRPTSTATMMTMALTVLLILVPAVFSDKIPIGECCLCVVHIVNVLLRRDGSSRWYWTYIGIDVSRETRRVECSPGSASSSSTSTVGRRVTELVGVYSHRTQTYHLLMYSKYLA